MAALAAAASSASDVSGSSTAMTGTPLSSSGPTTLSQHHAPCHAPCTRTTVEGSAMGCSLAHLLGAAGEEVALDGGRGVLQRALVGRGRLVVPTEPGQQVGAGRMEEVVAVELARRPGF